MDAEMAEHVFEPFYTSKPFGQGSGLALSTVYGFVQQSGCNVSIDSAPGPSIRSRSDWANRCC